MDNPRTTPTVPSILLGVLFFILIGSAFMPARWFGVTQSPLRTSRPPVDFTQLQNDSPFIKDINKDGEISWAEVVRSTAQGSSSIIELQNEKPDPIIIARLNDPDNLTASFSKNLYLASTQITNSGGVDEQTQKQVLDQLVSDEKKKIVFKKYAYADIKVANSDSQESIKTYGNIMATTLKNLITRKKIENDFSGLTRFTQSGDEKDLDSLVKDASNVNTILKKLLTLSVPPSAIAHHLLVVNQVSVYQETLLNLSKISSDPIRTSYVLNSYPDTIISTLLIYKKLTEYFNFKNVTFSGKEPGYVFVIGYTLE